MGPQNQDAGRGSVSGMLTRGSGEEKEKGVGTQEGRGNVPGERQQAEQKQRRRDQEQTRPEGLEPRAHRRAQDRGCDTGTVTRATEYSQPGYTASECGRVWPQCPVQAD